MNRIGIYGGTFDPVHNMHLAIADSFSLQMGLDSCLFIPAHISPFKTETVPTEAVHRVNMVRLAIEDNPLFSVSTYEIDKGGVSYTYDTLHYLKSQYPEAEFFILTGMDQVTEFKRWKNWEQILSEAVLCVARRPGYRDDSSENSIDALGAQDRIVMVDAPVSGLSSSTLREMIKKGEPIDQLVPSKVINYISEHSLYR